MVKLGRAQPIPLSLLLLGGAWLFAWMFAQLGEQMPHLAIEWKMFWQATHGLRIEYIQWVFNPPWSLVLLWPLSLFSLHHSWGLLIFVTLLSLAALIPRPLGRATWLLSFALLLSSYPLVQMILSGNIEVLMLLGFLLLPRALFAENPWWLAASLIFLSSKLQGSWLVLLVLAPYLWRGWPRTRLFQADAMLALFCLPLLLWKGVEWLALVGNFPHESQYNLSLLAAAARLGLPAWVAWLGWLAVLAASLALAYRLRRRGPLPLLGLLSAAGLLLAPYSSYSTLIMPLSLGVIPLLARRVWPHVLLALAYSLPVFLLWAFRPELYTYFTGVLLLTCAWLALVLLTDQRKHAPHPAEQAGDV